MKKSFILVLFCFQVLMLSQTSFAQKIAARGLYFGMSGSVFFEDEFLGLPLHSGSLPFIFGYEIYPTKNYGFGLGFFTSGDLNVFSAPEISKPNEFRLQRFTTVNGLKFSSKYWLAGIKEGYGDIGFETGISAVRLKFYDYYEQLSSPFNSEFLPEVTYTIIPLHIGANVLLLKFLELGVQYNLNLNLGKVNEPLPPNSLWATSVPVPQIRRSYISATAKFIFVRQR